MKTDIEYPEDAGENDPDNPCVCAGSSPFPEAISFFDNRVFIEEDSGYPKDARVTIHPGNLWEWHLLFYPLVGSPISSLADFVEPRKKSQSPVVDVLGAV